MAIERDLIERAQQGDRKALTEIYETHKDAIATYLYYRLERDQALTDDLVAEVFIRMVEKIHTFQPERPLLAWLYTIARNLVADHYRQQGYQQSMLRSLEERKARTTGSPEQDVSIKLDAERVARILVRLTPAQATVLILRFIEGQSVAETAEALGRSEGAIKMLTQRALANARRILEN